MKTHSIAFVFLMSSLAGQQAYQAVVPSSCALVDGSHAYLVAGTIEQRRQLTLIDASLLSALSNHNITGLAFRRNATGDPFPGGGATLTVKLSNAARSATTPSEFFDRNHGVDLTTVFSGQVTLPSSPSTGSNPVPWTPENIIYLQFQNAFHYSGGTLAVEVTGIPDPVSPTSWWPADAVWQPTGGSAQSIGGGCGTFGGANAEWSFVTATSFVPGGTASFQAIGTPGNIAIFMLAGSANPQAVDLSYFGAPGCYLHLDYLLANVMTFFGPALLPQRPTEGGMALINLQLPTSTTFLGTTLASQWLSFGMNGMTTSNAHQWTVATQMPNLPMTVISAPVVNGEPAVGKVIPSCGHVFRFEYQ